MLYFKINFKRGTIYSSFISVTIQCVWELGTYDNFIFNLYFVPL